MLLVLVAAACSSAPSSAAQIRAAATQAVPTASAANATAAPTLAVVQTQAASTVQAAATAAEPRARAAATQAAPTYVAISTQVAATTLGPSYGTAVAVSPLRITAAKPDQADPTVTVVNGTAEPVNLAGWTLLVGNSPVAIPGTVGVTVPAHGSVTLHLKQGATTATEIYLGGASTPLATKLQTGAAIALIDARKQPATIYKLP